MLQYDIEQVWFNVREIGVNQKAWCAGEVVRGGQTRNPAGSHLCREILPPRGWDCFPLLDSPNCSGPAGPGYDWCCLLGTCVTLSSPFGVLLEGILLKSVCGNFDSGLSEIPGTESLRFRLLHGFPGHVLFFCLEILYQWN